MPRESFPSNALPWLRAMDAGSVLWPPLLHDRCIVQDKFQIIGALLSQLPLTLVITLIIINYREQGFVGLAAAGVVDVGPLRYEELNYVKIPISASHGKRRFAIRMALLFVNEIGHCAVFDEK